MIPIHGCVQCKYKGCMNHSCPICHPEKHQHHHISRTSNNCGTYSFGLDVVHDWQEIGDLFICRRCGKQIKRYIKTGTKETIKGDEVE